MKAAVTIGPTTVELEGSYTLEKNGRMTMRIKGHPRRGGVTFGPERETAVEDCNAIYDYFSEAIEYFAPTKS